MSDHVEPSEFSDPFNLFSSLGMAKKLCRANWLSLFSRQWIKSRYIICLFQTSSILCFSALCPCVNHCRTTLEKFLSLPKLEQKMWRSYSILSAGLPVQPLWATSVWVLPKNPKKSDSSPAKHKILQEMIVRKCCPSFVISFNHCTLLEGRILCSKWPT